MFGRAALMYLSWKLAGNGVKPPQGEGSQARQPGRQPPSGTWSALTVHVAAHLLVPEHPDH